MLLTKSVMVKIINFNENYYKNKGYECKYGNIIEIPVKDISIYSKQKVELLCDICKENIKTISIESLHNCKSYKNGNYVCDKCKKEIISLRECEICGSHDGVSNYLNQGKLLCKRHQRMLYDTGSIRRTVNDKNEIRSYENYLEFDTYGNKGNITGTFKVDLDMEDFINNHKIHSHKDGYACYKFKDENGKTKNMRLHRYIMNVHLEKSDKTIIDHISRDKADDRKENLRKANFKDNIVNTGMLSTNTSGHKGISWEKRSNKWEAYIHKDNIKISLGKYIDFDRAVKVREIAEIIYFGKNNPNYDNLINTYINEPEIQQFLKE